MEEYIPLEQLETHIRHKQKAESLDKTKSAVRELGSGILSLARAGGRGLKGMAEKIEANRKPAQPKDKPKEESYMMGVAHNFVDGSFGSGTSSMPLANSYNNQKRGKKGG